MDSISLLSDDLILKILSELPSKVAVTTSLLSKRWYDLWKHVPKLLYFDPSFDSEYWRASRFVDKFLLLHNKATVLETMHLSLSGNCSPTDIATWISIAVLRGVRNLRFFQYRPCGAPLQLPMSLYTCRTLVRLRVHQATIVDVPLTICFQSLKTLSLIRVDFWSDEIVQRLLSGCPILEELVLILCSYDNVKSTFTITVPSLLGLVVMDLKCGTPLAGFTVGLVIKTPSLLLLGVVNHFNWVSSLVNMPKLVKAYIKLPQGDSQKLLQCLTSARQLSLCVKPPMDSYPIPIGVFNQLVSLKLCTCSSNWFRLILRHTPKLRVLRFQLQANLVPRINYIQRCCDSYGDVQTQWERPSSVPECLISRLETVEWIHYNGTEAEKQVVMYLLENSGQLKKMTIKPLKSTGLEERHRMLQELSSTQRISSKCRLLFT